MKKVRELVYSINISLALQESVLEGLRLAFFAALSVLVTFLLERVTNFPNPEGWTIILTVALRLIDKYKYQSNKFNSRGKNNEGLIF